jgi:hypothetical protein
LKANIGGTDYSIKTGSLDCIECIDGKGKATFRVRQALAGATRFVRGKEIYIYDDALSETVDTSNTYGEWGDWGVGLKTDTWPDNGEVSVALPAGRVGAQGTFEANICVKEITADMAGSTFVVAHYLTHGGTDYNFITFGVSFSGSVPNAKAHPYVLISAYTGGNFANEVFFQFYPLNRKEIEMQLERYYRFSVNWNDVGDGTTDFQVFVDGVLDEGANLNGIVTMNPDTSDKIVLNGIADETGLDVLVNDVREFNVPQNWQWIREHARQRIASPGTEATLTFYYQMNEGAGNHCHDTGPNAYGDATFVDGVDFSPYWFKNLTDYNSCGDYPYEDSWTSGVHDMRFFAGKVETVSDSIIGGVVLESTITCVDHGFLAAKRLVTTSITGRSLRYIAQKVVKIYMIGEQVGSQCMPEGASVPRVDWLYLYVNKALDQLRDMCECIWYIDSYREMRCHAKDYRAAPFDLLNTDSPKRFLQDSLTYEESRGKYFNRIVGRIQTDAEGEQYIVAEDAAEIAAKVIAEGGSGIYESYEELANAGSIANGVKIAKGKLAQCAEVGSMVTYITRTHGLHAGMWQHIECTDMNVDDDYLIIEVKTFDQDGYDIRHKITATTSHIPRDLSTYLDAVLDSKTNWKTTLPIDATPIGVYSELMDDGVKCGDTATVVEGP